MSGTGRLDIGCKADALLVGARYDPEDGHLVLAQAYERRGALWTDAVILDRGARLARLRTGRRVVVGEVDPEVLGDFAVLSRLGLQPADGREHLLLGESSTGRDNLGVPSFLRRVMSASLRGRGQVARHQPSKLISAGLNPFARSGD